MSVPEHLTNSPRCPCKECMAWGEGCNPGTQCNDTPLSPSTNFDTWWHPWCPHSWRLAGLSSYLLQDSAGLLTMARMSRTSQCLRHWCHWWGSWHWTSVTFESLIWWEWRWLWLVPPITLVAPGLDLGLAVVPNLCSWCTGCWPSLGTSHHSAAAGRFAVCRNKSWLWKLNGVDAGGMEQGWSCLLASVCTLVLAWVINCQLLPRLTGLMLSWACLPTQLMAPDNVNVASHTSSRLNPSLNHCHL